MHTDKNPLTFRAMNLLFCWLALSISACGGQELSTPVFSLNPEPVSVMAGENAAFHVHASGPQPITYQWQKNGIDIPGATGDTYTTPPITLSDTGALYCAYATNRKGTSVSANATLTVRPADLGTEFPVGVWMQNPPDLYNGKTIARRYYDSGVNTFVGLWAWPNEFGMGAGYNARAAKALKDCGMKAYAGGTEPDNDVIPANSGPLTNRQLWKTAVDWNADPANAAYGSTFIGYMLGDEADMFVVNYDTQPRADMHARWEWSLAYIWKAKGDALRDYDLLQNGYARKYYANFGKPFAGGSYKAPQSYAESPAAAFQPAAVPSATVDFKNYVWPLTIYSCDFYAITDPWEARSNHGVWKYGIAVTNARERKKTGEETAIALSGNHLSGSDVWGFLEASAPWNYLSSPDAGNEIAKHMPPELVKPAVWMMVIHGASGIVYFCHDFNTPHLANAKFAALLEPGMPQAMAETNALLHKYSNALLAAPSGGITTTITTGGPVTVQTLTKNFGGYTYVFAIGDGNSANIYGAAVMATIPVTGSPASVILPEEGRSLPVNAGSFTDTFAPYELHIYRY